MVASTNPIAGSVKGLHERPSFLPVS